MCVCFHVLIAAGGSFGTMFDVTSAIVSGTVYYLAVDSGGSIYLSQDLGATWTRPDQVLNQLFAISIGTNGNAYTTGNFYRVFRGSVSDGLYSNWVERSPSVSGPTNRFYDISTYDGVNVIAVGGNGNIYYSADSGESWTAGTSGVTSIVYCVDHGDGLTAIAAGASSYVARTTDGGSTWSTLSVFASSTVTVRFHSIHMRSAADAFVAGDNGEIYATDDSGATWTLLISTGSIIYSLEQFSSDAGSAGAIAGAGIYAITECECGNCITCRNELFICCYFIMLLCYWSLCFC